MKSQEDKLQDQLRRAQQMREVQIERGYETTKIDAEITECQIKLNKIGKQVFSQLSKDSADAARIRAGECLKNHTDRVYDLYRKGLLSESEAMNQDF